MAGDVGPGGQVAVHGGLAERRGLVDEPLQGLHHHDEGRHEPVVLAAPADGAQGVQPGDIAPGHRFGQLGGRCRLSGHSV